MSIISLILLPAGTLPSSFILPETSGQVEPILAERGRHYEIFDNGDGSFTYRTGGVPLWALNPETNQYQPTYHKTHSDGTEEFRNGYITVKAKGDTISFYDAITGDDLRVQDEDWLLFKDGQKVNSILQNTEVIQKGNSLTYRMIYTSDVTDYIFDYTINENQYLDHDVHDWNIKEDGNYQWQQKWKTVPFDQVNEHRVDGKFSHDFTSPILISQNVPENTHQNFEIRNNGKLIAFEKTDKFTGFDESGNSITASSLVNFEMDSENNEIKYHWVDLPATSGDILSFNHGDTFTSSNPTVDGRMITTEINTGSSCTENNLQKQTGASGKFKTELRDSDENNFECSIAFVQWSTSSIDNSASISNTVFKYDHSDGNTLHSKTPQAHAYSGDISSDSDTTLWNNLCGGTSYANLSETASTNQETDLGSSADGDVLSNDRFGFGLCYDNMDRVSVGDVRYEIKNEEGNGTPSPTLEVTYTLPSCTPNAPTSPSFTSITTSTITTNWIAPSNCTMIGVEVERNIDGAGWINIYDSTVKTSHADTSLNSNEEYDYRVRYESSDNVLGAYLDFTATETIPDQVTGLTATSISSTQINLAWNNISGDDENGYKIERNTDGAGWITTVADTGDQTTTYFDTGLTSNESYQYRVSAISDGGAGIPSSTATDETIPDQVTGLTATSISSTQINLAWNNISGDDENGYKIEINVSGAGWTTEVADTGDQNTTYNDTGLIVDTEYSYRISAISDGGIGSASTVAVETPKISAEELQSQIDDLTSTIIILNATANSQQLEIDHLYTIWEDVRDAIISWLLDRP